MKSSRWVIIIDHEVVKMGHQDGSSRVGCRVTCAANLDRSWSGHLDGVDVKYVIPLEVKIWIDLKAKFEGMCEVNFEDFFVPPGVKI